MGRFRLLALSLLLAAPLPAQRNARPQPGPTPLPDARVGAGSVRANNPNILYPGSPAGTGQPGSILTPGSPRPPAASPPTPGVAQQPRPRPQRFSHDPRGYASAFGYGYIYPIEVASQEDAPPEDAAGSSSAVIQVPPRPDNEPPQSHIYDVRENAAGQVEMRSLGTRAEQHASDEYSLIALKGGLIYAVERYWRQDETFRFLTMNGKEFVISPSELDLEFTQKLNADLGKQFRGP